MNATSVRLPVARGRALSRAVIWCVPSVVLSTVGYLMFRGLDFQATGVSNRLVDYAVAAVALFICMAALSCFVPMLRWLLLGIWPAALGVIAQQDALELRLGPFGSRRLDWKRLTISYPFEDSVDLEEGRFEAFLPAEKQLAILLPRITHPDAPDSVERLILKFVAADEGTAASLLRPWIERWRNRQGSPIDVSNDA